MMTNDVVSVLKTALGRWVCRKDASSHPALLTDPDLNDLAVATRAGIESPPSPEGEREWGNLRELTKNWLVQQKPGVAPGPLQTHDFEHLAALLTPTLPQAQPPDAVADTPVELWTREAAELVFAREHLERCL